MANHEQDLLYVHNPTSESFKVLWGGFPYELSPGQQRIFPRFIAEHFAKHLADKILLQKEKAYKDKHGKDKPFLNSKRERPATIETIIKGVYQYFRPDKSSADPAALIAQQVDQLNKPKEKALDLGAVDTNRAVGALEEDEPDDEPLDQIETPEPVTETAPGTPVKQKSRADLFKEAKTLGLKPTPSMSNDELLEAIKKF